MRNIVLDTLCIEGFRSFIEPAVIQFTDSPGLKFIAGTNQAEPALGANGAGKSSVFDAISFALYGTSIRGLRASELVSRGKRGTRVIVLLVIDGELHAVARTAPPNRLTIDDQPAEQGDVDRLVGLSRARFLNSVVFGQAVPLFLDMPVPERGDLLDEVLDLEIWMEAALRAGKQHGERTAELNSLWIELSHLRGRLDGLPDIARLQEQEDQWQAQRDARLGELIDRYEAVRATIAQIDRQVAAVDRSKLDAVKERYDRARATVSEHERKQAAVTTSRNRVVADIEFFETNRTCPTCGRAIGDDFSETHIRQLVGERGRYGHELNRIGEALAVAVSASKTLEQDWQIAVADIAGAEREQAVFAEQLRARRDEADDLQRQAVRTRNETNPYAAQKAAAIAERDRVAGLIAEYQRNEAAKTAELAGLGYWRQGFRRVRLFCLENVLQELALETRNSLLSLGLVGWRINYMTATETKAGTVRLGVQVEVEPPQQPSGRFDVLSGGEGQRARLAASLGLASLVQRWAGVWWNIEVWDEPTAWLSEAGVENLLDCLAQRADARNKSIFIADHRALNHSGFAELYQVIKDHTGSHWQRV
jgi:DNA repair exonuclease SbcCD ATPase subunit